jgi:hypothetical protein
MWHIDRRRWDLHKKDMLASYQRIQVVRQRIGLAEMTNHGWLTPDRSVQFSDWDSGDRVIVNFGERPFAADRKRPLPGRSFVLERTN